MDWMEILYDSDSEDESRYNYDNNQVFKFEHGSYLTEFDDGYDRNEDPEFEEPTGLEVTTFFGDFEFDTLKMIRSNGDDINEEFEEGDAFDDTRVCFKSGKIPTCSASSMYRWTDFVSLGPCKHMCCLVWHLKPINTKDPYDSPMNTFWKHHRELGCTDNKCKDPNAAGILCKAIHLARASKIFNPRTAAKLKSTAKSFKISIREVPDQASNNPSDMFTMISIHNK